MIQQKYIPTGIGYKSFLTINDKIKTLVDGDDNLIKIIELNLMEIWGKLVLTSAVNCIHKGLGVSIDQILSKNRVSHIRRARFISNYLVYEYSLWTLQSSAKNLGGLNHSTMLYYKDVLSDPNLEKFDPILDKEYKICLDIFLRDMRTEMVPIIKIKIGDN